MEIWVSEKYKCLPGVSVASNGNLGLRECLYDELCLLTARYEYIGGVQACLPGVGMMSNVLYQ